MTTQNLASTRPKLGILGAPQRLDELRVPSPPPQRLDAAEPRGERMGARLAREHLERHYAMQRPDPAHPVGGNLDKTLSNVRDGLPRGPERTPGGFGQTFRD